MQRYNPFRSVQPQPSYSSGPCRSEPIECSNCKVKDLTINRLESRNRALKARLRMLEARQEMERNPEDHACQSGAILNELLDDMEDLLYTTENYGKLYYACPKLKPPKHFGCEFFLWKEDRLRDLMSSPGAPSAGPSTPSRYSSVPSTPPSYSSGPSTPQIYSPGSSRNAECSNCVKICN
ncbi:hypothetical protein Tco_1120602 [Tanacetum coccineum]